MSLPPPPPPGPGYGSPYGMPAIRPTNGKATASLATGIGSLVFSWCCGLGLVGIVAIVLGVKARSEISASAGAQQGEGLAMGGIVTGAIAVVLGLLFLVVIVVAVVAGARFDTGATFGTDF